MSDENLYGYKFNVFEGTVTIWSRYSDDIFLVARVNNYDEARMLNLQIRIFENRAGAAAVNEAIANLEGES